MEYSAPAVATRGPFAELQSSDGIHRNRDSISGADLIFAGRGVPSRVVAQYGHVQVFNPVASGVIVLIDNIMVHNSSSNLTAFHSRGAELAVDVGVWTSRSGVGAAGLAHIRTESNVVQLGTKLTSVRLSSNIGHLFPIAYPFELEAGESLILVTGIVDIIFEAVFWGREI